MSFLVIPTAGICPKYFKRHRGLATGVSVSGSSLGGVLWPVALDQLLHVDGISFNWSIRIVGFIMIPLLAIVMMTVRPPIDAQPIEQAIGDNITTSEKNEKKVIDRSAMKRPPFILLCLGLFFGNLGFYTVFFYTSTYAVDLGMSQKLAFHLLSIINGASMFGRILPGIVADRWGKFNILTASALFGGIIAFCWTSATSVPGVVVWAAAYGFASGV